MAVAALVALLWAAGSVPAVTAQTPDKAPSSLRDRLPDIPRPEAEDEPQENPPAAWAAWAEVKRLRGEATVTLEAIHARDNGLIQETSRESETIRISFVLERTHRSGSREGSWRGVEARASFGGNFQKRVDGSAGWSSHRQRLSQEYHYNGPLRDIGGTSLVLDFEGGKWEFFYPASAAEPYTVVQSGFASFSDGRGNSIPESVDQQWQREDVLHGFFDGVAPQRPTALFGSFRDEQGGELPSGSWRSLKTGSIVLEPEVGSVELRVEIEGYERWLPLGNLAAPDQPGGRLVTRAKLVTLDGSPVPRARSFRFELSEVTREPGVAMNWPRIEVPAAGERVAPDLRFAPRGPGRLGEEAQTWEIDAPGPEVEATIESLDYGAAGTLRVTCTLEDGRTLVGRLERSGEERLHIPVPDRRVGSLIAESWRQERSLDGSDAADADPQPVGDGNEGDGFSNYEEYRGFVHNGRHRRLDPGRKDLFVLNSYGPEAVPGLQLLARISGLQVHGELRRDELWEMTMFMNWLRSAGSPRSSQEPQTALFLTWEPAGNVSYNDVRDVTAPRRPRNTWGVKVLRSLKDPGRERELAATVAHEILHAIGVRHHGESDLGFKAWLRREREVDGVRQAWFEERPVSRNAQGQWVYDATAGRVIRIFANPAQELLPVAGVLDQPQVFWVGVYGGQHSGAVDCVMRYDCATAYIVPGGGRGQHRYFSPGETIGMGLCESSQGTDYNSPDLAHSRFHNAVKGNCAHQFCVRDDAPVR